LISKDDLIGAGTLTLTDLIHTRNIHQWVPLFYKEQDAGSILVELSFFPDGNTDEQPGISDLSQKSVVEPTELPPVLEQPLVDVNQPTVFKEVQVIREEPVIIKEQPIIHEKKIITERPIITEKTIIYSEQQIIKEKPELHQNIMSETVAPVYLQEPTIVHRETGSDMPDIPSEGGVSSTTVEYRKEAPIVNIEKPEIFHKDVIIEKPIIHEKDIIHREKNVVIQKPELHEQHVYQQQPATVVTEETLRRGGFADVIDDSQATVHRTTETLQAAPEFVKLTPEIYEKQIIHEKPVITQQPVIFTEREEIHEKPEYIEKTGVRQEAPVVEKEPIQMHVQHGSVNP